jgi:molecular chaperone DnaK (HSP70)
MAGNSTGIPLVQQAMEELFGVNKVMRKVHPKHCVALGAAILAARIGPNVVCAAPVRGGSGRECGHVNKEGASVCAGCGTALEAKPGTGAAHGAADHDAGPSLQIGGIAPFHYGTQSAGDKFNLYIEKGEPYPTEGPKTHPFTTRAPNARMISIPVYGGEDLDHASRNEKQGEAFAVLPPGLPQGAAILIRLSLDSDGIFEVAAHLDDGTDLHPWVVTGENDAKAIDVIQGVEKALAEAGQNLSPQEMGSLENARNQAFEAMKDGDFQGAIDKAKGMNRIIDEAGPEAPDMLENVIGYLEFILHEYAWAIDPNQAYRLNNLLEEAKRAMESGTAKQKEEKTQAIIAQTERLPQVIQVFVGVKMAIRTRIHPNDPALAMNLEEELEEVEGAFKSRNRMAESKLTAYVAKLQKAIAEIQPGGMKCHNGHTVPAGQRYCSVCKEDTWLVDAKGAATSSSDKFRRKK